MGAELNLPQYLAPIIAGIAAILTSMKLIQYKIETARSLCKNSLSAHESTSKHRLDLYDEFQKEARLEDDKLHHRINGLKNDINERDREIFQIIGKIQGTIGMNGHTYKPKRKD